MAEGSGTQQSEYIINLPTTGRPAFPSTIWGFDPLNTELSEAFVLEGQGRKASPTSAAATKDCSSTRANNGSIISISEGDHVRLSGNDQDGSGASIPPAHDAAPTKERPVTHCDTSPTSPLNDPDRPDPPASVLLSRDAIPNIALERFLSPGYRAFDAKLIVGRIQEYSLTYTPYSLYSATLGGKSGTGTPAITNADPQSPPGSRSMAHTSNGGFESELLQPIDTNHGQSIEKPTRPKPVITPEGQKEYFIDQIIGERERDGEKEYRVRWVGYGPKQDKWLPWSELSETEALDVWEGKTASVNPEPQPAAHIEEIV